MVEAKIEMKAWGGERPAGGRTPGGPARDDGSAEAAYKTPDDAQEAALLEGTKSRTDGAIPPLHDLAREVFS